jgi:hypothetical protein
MGVFVLARSLAKSCRTIRKHAPLDWGRFCGGKVGVQIQVSFLTLTAASYASSFEMDWAQSMDLMSTYAVCYHGAQKRQ